MNFKNNKMMNQEIKISIIVPVYNLQEQIERCINSITAQTYKNIEILVVDDGSKDNSCNIIKKLAERDSRIIPIFKENAGVTSARLAGLTKATGDYIGFVDGDDEIEIDMYEFLLDNALKYEVDISHCGYQMVFDDGRVNYFYNTGRVVLQDRNTGLKDLLEGSFIEPGLWNKLFHKKLFSNLLNKNLMDTSIKINEDLLMNFYLFSDSQNSIYQDVCKYRYMAKGMSNSIQSLNEHKIFDPIKVKSIIISSSDKELKPFAWKAYIKTCISVYNMLAMAGLNKYNKQAKIVRQKLLDGKKYWGKLGKKQKMLIWMILHLNIIYEVIYRLYEKYLMNKRYD